MGVTDAGRNLELDLLIGAGGTVFSNANAHIGVGGGAGANTAFAAGQTDLQGASKTRKAMDSTYPSRSGNVVTFRATFGSGDANYNWLEWGTFNASSAGTMYSRKQEDLGTKTSAAIWVFTTTLTKTYS
jgi:hypothetical protein